MTQEYKFGDAILKEEGKLWSDDTEVYAQIVEIEKYETIIVGMIAAAVKAEREACAKVCDGWSKRDDDVGGFIGRAIRARNTEE